MRFMLPSRFIGTFTAAAIALTSLGVTPAAADSDDRRVARIAATILGIAVVGSIINDRKHDKREEREAYREPVRQHGYHKPRQGVRAKPLPLRVDRKQLPGNCLRTYQTRRGDAHMFGRRCLERNYRAVNRLPQNCAMQIRTDRGTRAGFDARCLRRNGYSLARG
ncbi:MAG: hypothetical protein P8P40_11475 [Sulfitobacter sp.]|nr:hypothetical protein [Sulfitobacter sp.]MDG1354330.1 hypothetical protein [Sulfitobacter sp.]